MELKMVEGEPGTRGQGKKHSKSSGPLLLGKEKIMKNIQPRPLGTGRGIIRARGRGLCAWHDADDRFRPWREKSLKMRAIAVKRKNGVIDFRTNEKAKEMGFRFLSEDYL